jgi:hypothetical protein
MTTLLTTYIPPQMAAALRPEKRPKTGLDFDEFAILVFAGK